MHSADDQRARLLYQTITDYLDQRNIWYSPVPRGAIDSPAAWRPYLDPPRLLYWDDLDQRGIALAFAHEFGHLILHPPGSHDPGPSHDKDREERTVHVAAEALWERAGLTGYAQGILALGVPPAMLSPHADERSSASALSQDMIKALFGQPVQQVQDPHPDRHS